MRKRTPRQHFDPMGWVKKRLPLADDQQRDICIAYRASLQAMLRGHGTEQAWSTLSCSFNIALILCEQGLCAAAIPTIKLAQQALVRVHERAQCTGKWVFDGDGIRVVLATANIHDEQLEMATRGQIIAALDEVHRRIEIGETV